MLSGKRIEETAENKPTHSVKYSIRYQKKIQYSSLVTDNRLQWYSIWETDENKAKGRRQSKWHGRRVHSAWKTADDVQREGHLHPAARISAVSEITTKIKEKISDTTLFNYHVVKEGLKIENVK